MRSFIPGEELVLNVNISDNYIAHHISSIAWYHNGTQITAGNKYSITYSNSSTSLTNTSLSVQNMVGSDAGEYEVKIESIEYYGDSSSPHCDSILLPLFEKYAIHAPVTFTVQEHCIPTYDPQPIVSSYSIPECLDRGGCNIDLRSSGHNISRHNISDNMLGRYRSVWYINGVRIGNGNMYNSSVIHEEGLVINSLQITYNNTEDITGNYVGLTLTDIYYRSLSSECQYYYYYLSYYIFLYQSIFEVSYWRISGELLILYYHFLTCCVTSSYEKSVRLLKTAVKFYLHNYCVCIYNDRFSISSVPTFWRVSTHTSRVNHCELYCCG